MRSVRSLAAVLALAALVVTSCAPAQRATVPPTGPDTGGTAGATASAVASASAPAAPPVRVCGATRTGPAQPPPAAVRVDPAVVGDLTAKTEANPPGTTFWLAPGTHRLPKGEFAQVQPKDRDSYVGAPGAVLDGGGKNRYAFTGTASGVTIRSITVRGFVSPVNEGVVNHDSGARWVIEDNTLTDNRGAAMMAGTGQVMRGNCLKDNGQYGLNACCGSLQNLRLEGNEFVGNNADDVEKKHPGCGCSGAMKFWAVNGANIAGNWIHDNHGPGVWADTNNNDFLIEGNLIEGNDGAALFYETSYNAIVRDNMIRRNNLVDGKAFVDRGDSFPSGVIYLSESGGEARVKARTDRIEIYRNDFVDNWSGVTLWENSDRFCNSLANTSTGACTLLVDRVTKCKLPAITKPPLFDDCRWKTRRVWVHDNTFSVDPRAIDCSEGCARMAVFANFGTYPAWSPYKGEVVQRAIAFSQENRWYANSYRGPWTFTPVSVDLNLTPAQWQAPPYRQDQGSSFRGVTASPSSSQRVSSP
jgi:hypothetical protein